MQVLDSHSHPVSDNLDSRNAVSKDFNPPSSPEHQIFDSLLKIAQSVDCHEILQIAVQLLQTDLGVDRVVIYQRQENGQAVITAEAAKSEWQNSLGMAIADLRDLQSLAGGAAGFTTEAIHDVFETAFLDRYCEILTQQKVRSSLIIPLVLQSQEVQSQNWGAIVMQSCSHRRGWDPLEIEHCERLASHVAIALQRALHSQQQEKVIQDLQRREQTLQDKNYQLTSLASQQNFLTLQANAKLKNTVLDLQETNEVLEHQTATAKVLADFILKIRQSLELDQILETTTSEIHRCLQVDRLAICRIDAQNIGTIIAESVVAPWPSTLGIEFSAELLSVKCQKELSAMPYKAVPDVEATYHDTVPQMLAMLKTWGVKAKLVVPILQKTQLQKENLQGSNLWGFMIAHQCTNTRHWLSAELDLLTQVASHVAVSIEQSELYRKRQQVLEVMERTEQMLVVQHEQIGHILSSSPGILYSSLAQGSHYQRIFFGTNLFTLLGYTSLDSIETDFWLNCIHPEDRASVQLLSDRPIISQEYRFRHQDGTYRWLYDQQKVVYDDNGSPLEWIGYCVDISNRKHIEEKLKASLSEKEVLLKEIHHRVKNNLNIIISLLNLQSNYVSGHVTDDAIIDMFMDSQSRIYTMALIHEQLYGSEDLARLNFADYVGDLVNHLTMSCLPSSGTQIELAINIAPVTLNIETATPCGLILNELVTNAFKHAFLDGRSGTISISLTHHANHLQLMIQDDGVGFAPDIDWQNSPTLGLRLVRILAQQLDATLTQSSGATGTCFCLTLSELAYEARI